MHRRFPLLFLLLFAALGAEAAVFKIATVAPDGSEWMNEHYAAAEEIKKRTDGRVQFKFYGGGVMGNDKKVLRKMRIGQLQGAAFTTSGLIDRYFDVVLYGLPFVFRSQDEVDFVRAELDDRLLEGLEEAGLVAFGFAGGGFAQFMSNSPIATHSNLEGKKIWVPAGDVISFTALESMDLSPVVLPLADVMTGLQTGLLDVVVTPPVGALLLQWYTKVNYITDMPVAYTIGVLALDKRAFARIDAADQDIVREVMRATYERLDQINRSDNVEARDALLNSGLELVEPNSDDMPFWRSVASRTNEEMWRDTAVDKSLYQDMLNLLERYREGRAASRAADGAGGTAEAGAVGTAAAAAGSD